MRNSVPLDKISKLPKAPGVYFLKNTQGEIFYVGKAINIKNRVQNHKTDNRLFSSTSASSWRDGPEKIHAVEWIQTANEIGALLKESLFIKKLQPKMNTRLRDDKKYFYVGITKEDFPRVFITHQPLANSKSLNTDFIGPFTDGMALKRVLKYLRKLFPYYATNGKRPYASKKHGNLPCAWCHIEMCPGPYSKANCKEYLKDINSIKKILSGQKDAVSRKIRVEMKKAAKEKNYEKAAETRDLLESIENIFTHHNIVLPWHPEEEPKKQPYEQIAEYLSELAGADLPVYSIEGYDISNMQGKEATASMVRFDHGHANKSLYRKFNIYTHSEPDDYKMMREVIKRRLEHKEWPTPDLVLIDGGKGQLSAALSELKAHGADIPVISLAKREEEFHIPGKKSVLARNMPPDTANILIHVRDEAHRFAVSYHRKLRAKKLFR